MFPNKKKLLNFCLDRLALFEQTISESRSRMTKTEVEIIGNKDFNELAEKLDLDLSRDLDFVKWPLFLGKEEEGVNVCAVCFGALSLVDRNKKETDATNEEIAEYLNATINTIILLHLREISQKTKNEENTFEEYVYWPRNYNVGTTQIEAGTINQTTLSLSTLYKLGFLEKISLETNRTIGHNALKERVKFVIKALKWILYVENRDGRISSWSFAPKCKEINNNNEIKSATLPTHYCVETLEKFYKLFTENREIKLIVDSIDDSIISKIRASCDASILYFKLKQNEHDGGFFKNSNETKSTIFHTCIAEKMYCFDTGKDYKNLKLAISFLVKKLAFRHLNFKFDECFEKHRYEITRILYKENNEKYIKTEIKTFDDEEFEMFPETLLILCNMSILELDSHNKDKLMNYWQKKIFRKSVSNAYYDLFKRFCNIDGHVFVKGRRESSELKFPIYNIYYAKLCLYALYNSLVSDKKVIYFSFTPLLLYIIIGVLIVFLMYLAIALDSKSSGMWAITSAVTLLITTGIRYIINNSKFKSIKKI